jgi:hypothetical protein
VSDPRRPRTASPRDPSPDGAVEWDDRTPTRELDFQAIPTLLVIGVDAEVAPQLRKRVDPATNVIPIDSSAALVRQLRLIKSQPRMLLVDLRRPHKLLDVVVPFPDLLASAIVILWGGTSEIEASIRRAFTGAKIVRCDAETAIQDLATIIRLGSSR